MLDIQIRGSLELDPYLNNVWQQNDSLANKEVYKNMFDRGSNHLAKKNYLPKQIYQKNK